MPYKGVPMSSTATVKTIHLTKDKADEARKVDKKQKLLNRKAVISDAEKSATAYENAYVKLHAMNEQYVSLHHSFKDIATSSRESLNVVRHFFAHRKKDELLFGEYATGEAWAQARCGVGFDYVCRCLNPVKDLPLLKEVNGEPNQTRLCLVSPSRP